MDLTKGKPIEIADKPLFDEYFRKYPPEISELTFTNLFIWRFYYNFRFLEWKNHLVLFSTDYFKTRKESISKNKETILFYPPIGDDSVQIIQELVTSLKNVEFHRVPNSIVEDLKTEKEAHLLKIVWKEDRDNSDYVYEKSKLIELSGRKLYLKRRWLKRFLEQYPDFQFHLISDEWIETCRRLQIEWCDMNECRLSEDLMEEQRAITEALDHYPELKFRGGLLSLQGKSIAYTFGEILNPNTVVIHIEKALKQYEGAYQAINNFFCKDCCTNAIYVNREQDIGDPGLRQAKESYVPHHMVEKNIVYRMP
ncbi:MAG: phosphatidylglycerol lysyltransferase domain-containing protein [Candidatus Helarchaeota archaeon]|nr:phosphatidylglycerol lysyltransferase domain-containing protein [Candidatus Helarchaeota archaeon]